MKNDSANNTTITENNKLTPALIVKKEGILLNKTESGFENDGVLNPAVIQTEQGIMLFYRAVSKGNYSTIGLCKLTTPLTLGERSDGPILYPQFDYESKGIEDPRIVKIDDLYYLTYTAYDGINALGALAVSHDLISFEKRGLVVPRVTYESFSRLAGSKGALNNKYLRYNDPTHTAEHPNNTWLWDKNVVFFPRRIHGRIYFLHRIKPDIQLVSVNDLTDLTPEFWQQYFLHFHDHIVLTAKYRHEASYIGAGCPPIETEDGWLVIYHGVRDTIKGYVYAACAALLDLENPQKEIARLPYALFKPELKWELKGTVNNVCFPTGAIVRDDILYIYYGAADEHIACASVSLPDLLRELRLNPKKDDT